MGKEVPKSKFTRQARMLLTNSRSGGFALKATRHQSLSKGDRRDQHEDAAHHLLCLRLRVLLGAQTHLGRGSFFPGRLLDTNSPPLHSAENGL